MINKYVILDEISLQILKDDEETFIFNTKEEAIDFASSYTYCDAWQVIEIPFGEEITIKKCNICGQKVTEEHGVCMSCVQGQ